MKNSRRKFLTKITATMGAITFGKNILDAFPSISDEFQKEGLQRKVIQTAENNIIDFRYAPKDWQSTFCFPDDPHKNLVGKMGDLRIGHLGRGQDEKIFPNRISFGLRGKQSLQYVEQKLETPAIPIITTKLDGGDVTFETITFASNNVDEGRVDNVIISIYPKTELEIEISPEIILASENKFSFEKQKEYSIMKQDIDKDILFVFNLPSELQTEKGIYKLQLEAKKVTIEKPYSFILRLPQQSQQLEKLEDGFDDVDDLLDETKKFWSELKFTQGKVQWTLPDKLDNFRIASTRNILESREVKDGKTIFQVGPTCYRGLWIVDGHFLLEAARYLGFDKEAQQGLETIWSRQDPQGFFTAGAGEAHWKDTAVAVYALIRQAELSQNWDYFHEIYPDAHQAMIALRELVKKSKDDGSLNGKYGLLPKGFGDSGIGGIREEYTNTLWTIIAAKAISETAERLKMPKTLDLKEFYGELWFPFIESTKTELKTHPKGFKYLPMLMSSDPKWKEIDERKQPRPQAAQIYLSQAIFPGYLFKKDSPISNGHLKLMEAVMKEDIPIETGWMTNNALWPYNAAIFAQACLYQGNFNLARKVFYGFLNHASPLYAWREEQTLQDAPDFDFIGDMPHNWASAECIRYLRHRLILEEEKRLFLLTGIGVDDLESDKAFGLTYSPTRWGRVTLQMEPIDSLSWKMTFLREDFDEATCPPIEWINMPATIAEKYNFYGATGAKSNRNGDLIFIKGSELKWEGIWKKRK
ncbi:MAG: hypothetical protein HY964_09255 [Ignavibacteriales bacterium]|nr:hypothetical protein [Ignavibacteriales bacterium]